MTDPPDAIADASADEKPLNRILQWTALAVLLCVLAGRTVLPEMPFRTSPLSGITARTTDKDPNRTGLTFTLPNHTEPAGMTFDAVILIAGVLWFAGQAASGKLRIRGGWLGVLMVIFAALSLVSALRAGDRRGAMIFWSHQTALLLAGFLAMQLCADTRKLAATIAVLAALGVMLAVVGLKQCFFETAQRVADFEAHGAEILAAQGWKGDSPEAAAFQERISKAVPLGFFGLANPFASLMIVLTAAGTALSADRWIAAARDRKATAGMRKRGDVHLPTVSAVVTGLIVLAGLAAIALTLSRGAIGSAVLATVAAGLVLRFRKRLASRWRTWMLAAGLSAAAGVAAVVLYGLKHDSLGTKTMTFRWYYWTAAAEITAERPLWGVGPGNFGTAYEARRRPAAEEAVKTPHNFVMHAAAQYGLGGGLCYVLIIATVLIGLCRPICRPAADIDPPAGQARRTAALIIALSLTVVLTQWIFTDARGDVALLYVNGIEPAVVLAITMIVMFWAGRRISLTAAAPGRVTRVVLACGLAGFALHNFVTFSLWMPGAAIAFWLAAGAVLARTSRGLASPAQLRWPALLIATAAAGTFVAVLWWPVVKRAYATEMLVDGLVARDGPQALNWARQAAETDPLDSIPAADAARLFRDAGRPGDMQRAYEWALEAIRRDKLRATNHHLAADILWESAEERPESIARALEHMSDAVQRDPQSLSARIDFAKRLVFANRNREALEQIRAAEKIDAALLPESFYKLSKQQRAELQFLKARAPEGSSPR